MSVWYAQDAYVVINKAIIEWSPKMKDALPSTPSRPKALPDTVTEAGKECINQMYGNHATRIYEIFDSTYGPEVSQHIIQNVYGSLLSFEEYLNIKETKLSIVVALYVMDCRAQLKGHVLGAANMGLDESDLVALFKFVQQVCELLDEHIDLPFYLADIYPSLKNDIRSQI